MVRQLKKMLDTRRTRVVKIGARQPAEVREAQAAVDRAEESLRQAEDTGPGYEVGQAMIWLDYCLDELAQAEKRRDTPGAGWGYR